MGAGASASGDDSDCSPPRLSPSRSLAGLGGDSEQQRVLKLQAQAHWHRMILHANSMSKLHQPQQEQLHLVDRNDLAATAYSSSNQEAIEGREEAGFNNINKKGESYNQRTRRCLEMLTLNCQGIMEYWNLNMIWRLMTLTKLWSLD